MALINDINNERTRRPAVCFCNIYLSRHESGQRGNDVDGEGHL